MRFVLIISWVLCMFSSGCHNHPHPHETQNEPHLHAYLKLKKKSLDSALIELKAHANLTFKAHSKAHEWAELAARLDRAGKASLFDIQRLSHIVLEMARDNQEETAYLHELEDSALLWIELEKELEAEGTGLDTFFIRFQLTPTERE